MFNLWTSSTASPATVKEVNDHMGAMHQRITDLEQRVGEQSELLQRREAEHKAYVQQILRKKDEEIAMAELESKKAQNQLAKLENVIKERDCQIAYLLHRCSYLDEAASYAPILENLSVCLKSAFTANPPKVQTVKPTLAMSTKEQPSNPGQWNGNAQALDRA